VFLTAGRQADRREPCRHKLLDLAGDLCVSGRPLEGKIIACGTGHRENAELVRYLHEHQETL
jgi:UDP-3-O-acyl-N-acetylglucosamine deacetylase